MILYLEYEYKDWSVDATKYETRNIHLDLINSDVSTVEFDPGVIVDITNRAVAVAKISIHGKPALTHASSMIGRMRIQSQISSGRNFGGFVYCYYSPTDDRQLYRAKVYALELIPEGSATYFNVPNRHMPASINILHGPWSGSLIQVPLANTVHTSKSTTALEIQNAYGLGNDNTIFIEGEDIQGDLPAPIKLQLKNTCGQVITQYWIGLNVNSTPQSFYSCIEAETATACIPDAHPSASFGNTTQISVANTTDTTMLTWDLTSAVVTQMNGNQFHVLIRSYFGNPISNNVYYRFKIKDSSGLSTFWTGEQVFFPTAGLSNLTHDYGVIRMPPWRVDRNIVEPSAIQLILSAAQITAGAAIPIDIDALYFFPVDGFRNVIFTASAGGSLPDDGTLIDDCIENFSYIIPAGTTSIGAVAILGNPIMLHPNQDNRLVVLSTTPGGNDDADNTSEIKIWYRPQRLTI